MKTPVRSAAALALGSVLCVPSLATAQPTLNVADTAALVAGGTGAIASIRITCPTQTNNVRLETTLLQSAGATGHGGIGSIGSNITCNTTPQTVEIAIPAYTLSFRPGAATALASIGECAQNMTACIVKSQTKKVQLVQPR